MKFAILVVGALLVAAALGQETCPLQIYAPEVVLRPQSNSPQDGNMGHYTRSHGRITVAGAYGDNAWRGVAYVWHLNDNDEWDFLQTLRPSVRQNGAYFALNLDVWQDTIVVGAPYEEPGDLYRAGVVYVFQKQDNGQFSETARMIPHDTQASGYFGYTVAIQRNRLVVGARFTKNELINEWRAGKIYVYERESATSTEWSLMGQMRGEKKSVHWADEVRVEGDVILAGAPRMFGGEGAAYIFHKVNDSWTQMQRFRVIATDRDPATKDDHFGEGIAIANDGSYVVVCGERRRLHGTNSGGCQLYMRNGDVWDFHQYINPPRFENLRFGQRAAARSDMLFVGAWTSPLKAWNAGEVFVYAKCSDGMFKYVTNIYNKNGSEEDNFGKMIDVTNKYVAVGAPKEMSFGQKEAGAVHVFKISEIIDGFTGDVPEDVIVFEDMPDDVVAGETVKFMIVYSVQEARKIHLRITFPKKKIEILKVNSDVAAGSGALEFSFVIPDMIATGDSIKVRAGILQTGSIWKKRINGIFAYPVGK